MARISASKRSVDNEAAFFSTRASDGVRFNNTLMLEESFGWRGICVEPNDPFFSQLKKNRRCHCLNCCLYDRDGA